MKSRGDLIAAVSTPSGPAARGILRFSGPGSWNAALRIFRPRTLPPFRPFSLVPGSTIDGGMPALLLLMKSPKSYTREDMAEIHAVSSPLVLGMMLESALKGGARLASPGEFTARAFLHGRISLTEAEAVMKIISARSDSEARLAAAEIGGGLSRAIDRPSGDLAGILARIEMGLDFSDQDVPLSGDLEIEKELRSVVRAMKRLAGARDGSAPQAGEPSVLIAGPVNAGKSSLLNRCAGFDAAIVHESPGTTMDAVKVHVSFRGADFVMIDGPGFGMPSSGAERTAQEAYAGLACAADVLVAVIDGALPIEDSEALLRGRTCADAGGSACRAGAARLFPSRPPDLLLINKADLPPSFADSAAGALFPSAGILRASVLTGEGVEQLLEAVVRLISGGNSQAAGGRGILNARQRASLHSACLCATRARRALRTGLGAEAASVDVREAIEHLGKLAGSSVEDDVLDRIFRDFCVGK